VKIELQNISKKYGELYAVRNVSLTINSGECFFLLGPSGCGKTTILRAIAGFIELDEGGIFFDKSSTRGLPPNRRSCGMIFQNYALWPHMTVYGNIEFALKASGKFAREAIGSRIDEMLRLIHMEDMAEKMPSELSGGQQQRVALARALAFKPAILLLDEPLSNLDAKLRAEMRVELRRIIKELKITAIYVTHDQIEALTIADRCAVMRDGFIEQIAHPYELYFKPASLFVATFMGETNIVDGTVFACDVASKTIQIKTPMGVLSSSCFSETLTLNEKVKAVFRPESISFLETSDRRCNIFSARIIEELMLGTIFEYKLLAENSIILKTHLLNKNRIPFQSQNVFCSIKPDELMIFKPE
jgi:iron(III) transport system ATP-binding protein